ncbi:hypothetical protein FQR65_LT20516 [Abscondita terminalis]|nr:hypothetical protein FQR65_LT20516 [Abscondita terminalis]
MHVLRQTQPEKWGTFERAMNSRQNLPVHRRFVRALLLVLSVSEVNWMLPSGAASKKNCSISKSQRSSVQNSRSPGGGYVGRPDCAAKLDATDAASRFVVSIKHGPNTTSGWITRFEITPGRIHRYQTCSAIRPGRKALEPETCSFPEKEQYTPCGNGYALRASILLLRRWCWVLCVAHDSVAAEGKTAVRKHTNRFFGTT